MWNPKTGEPDKTRTTANDPVDWGHFDTLDALRYLVMGTLMADTPIAPPRRAEREPTRREMLRA
jgi:hypothetical protein